MDACKIAGLHCLRLVSEPTSASIAYMADEEDETDQEKHFLVFDYGGGTLDVSLLSRSEGLLGVDSTSGDTFLGGRDFDEALVKECIAQLRVDTGINLDDG